MVQQVFIQGVAGGRGHVIDKIPNIYQNFNIIR